ncbi:hypothetical protein FHL15_005161 [Xylaria flabelliformis]|uniref:Uncharacterized protein n=1 Tax=Xylaria flabelliformis TaxID=2512241 RepID=A0A553I1J2_9PEZI|nr:hypothetical protein FHL15_005161 [Xylaria flabelliformis]
MGKVHGSLARAGKLQASHPLATTRLSLLNISTTTNHLAEVEKQEKAKVPKGRAKKRLQYTRRFVNVTLTGGKRKMNPNPGS